MHIDNNIDMHITSPSPVAPVETPVMLVLVEREWKCALLYSWLTSVHRERDLVHGGSHDRSDMGLADIGHPPAEQNIEGDEYREQTWHKNHMRPSCIVGFIISIIMYFIYIIYIICGSYVIKAWFAHRHYLEYYFILLVFVYVSTKIWKYMFLRSDFCNFRFCFSYMFKRDFKVIFAPLKLVKEILL